MSPILRAKLIKLGKSVLLAAIGAALVSAEGAISDTSYGWIPWETAILTVAVNAIRLFVSKWNVVPALAMLLTFAPSAVRAQTNLASGWSFGPTVPFFTGEWDTTGAHGGFHGGMLAAGAGITINKNFKFNADRSVAYGTLGFPLFGSFQGGDPSTFRVMPGVTLGTFNNLIAAGVAVKALDVADGRAPSGAFADGLDKQDVVLLVAFSINLGAGSAPTSPPLWARTFGGSDEVKLSPPPNYVKCW